MRLENAAVAVYDHHAGAAAAVRELQRAGFDMGKVSVMACDCDRGVAGYYVNGGRVRCWGRLGAFWSGLWDVLSGWAFFNIPDIGPVLVCGPLAEWVVAGLGNPVLFSGLSPIGAGIYSVGISRDEILRYEDDLRAGKYLVLVHGAAGEVARGKEVLERTAAH
jgi:hypothetical protein